MDQIVPLPCDCNRKKGGRTPAVRVRCFHGPAAALGPRRHHPGQPLLRPYACLDTLLMRARQEHCAAGPGPCTRLEGGREAGGRAGDSDPRDAAARVRCGRRPPPPPPLRSSRRRRRARPRRCHALRCRRCRRAPAPTRRRARGTTVSESEPLLPSRRRCSRPCRWPAPPSRRWRSTARRCEVTIGAAGRSARRRHPRAGLASRRPAVVSPCPGPAVASIARWRHGCAGATPASSQQRAAAGSAARTRARRDAARAPRPPPPR